MGNYSYETSEGKRRGTFNIYQGRDGLLYMTMGNRYTALTLEQINDLGMDIYGLKDFDIDDFQKAYKL